MASHPDYPRTRLFVPEPLGAGAAVTLDKEQAHYLHQVLRLEVDDRVALFNGKNGEWLARIDSVGKSSAVLTLEKQLRTQTASPDIWLLFAPLKGGKTETIIEKATELGARKILPVYTRHTIVNRLNDERLQKIAVEAAEQSERTDVPEVLAGRKLEDILEKWGEGELGKERLLLFCDESGKSESCNDGLNSLVLQYPNSQPLPLSILIGPEGGFSSEELELLHRLPFAHGISLGPRILKADTAVFTALSCVMSRLGDWDKKPAFRQK